jgi:cyclohexa-1,5-dienecarbonyl-CoA hydratase
MGIAHVAAIDPEPVALAYFNEHLNPKSASSLRYAVKAARCDFAARIRAKIENVERMYLDGLMQTHDAVEGLHAYLEKRSARWQHH